MKAARKLFFPARRWNGRLIAFLCGAAFGFVAYALPSSASAEVAPPEPNRSTLPPIFAPQPTATAGWAYQILGVDCKATEHPQRQQHYAQAIRQIAVPDVPANVFTSEKAQRINDYYPTGGGFSSALSSGATIVTVTVFPVPPGQPTATIAVTLDSRHNMLSSRAEEPRGDIWLYEFNKDHANWSVPGFRNTRIEIDVPPVGQAHIAGTWRMPTQPTQTQAVLARVLQSVLEHFVADVKANYHSATGAGANISFTGPEWTRLAAAPAGNGRYAVAGDFWDCDFTYMGH